MLLAKRGMIEGKRKTRENFMGKALTINDVQDIIRDDQRQFDKTVAGLKTNAVTSPGKVNGSIPGDPDVSHGPMTSTQRTRQKRTR
jgi:hypothetical protein